MSPQETNTLLQFFKALANENRLKIIGVLSQRECSVDELSTLIGLKAPTISHHLSKLKQLGLVAMRTNGNDHLYRLDVDHLHVMGKEVFSSLTEEKVVALADDVEYEAWERKVLETFMDGDQIVQMPVGYKRKLAILKWLIKHFDEDTRYTEKEINEIILRYHYDYATLRRAFIDHGLMDRENGIYWRIEWQMPELK